MKKKKRKKRKIEKSNFLEKLANAQKAEDRKTNLILLGIIAVCGLLYYFGVLGTVVKGALSIWVWWAILASLCVGLLYWKEVIGGVAVFIAIIIVMALMASVYDNFTYKRCVDKFRERPYTYDIIKFVDCRMIKYSDAQGKSQERVREEMITKYSKIKY
jgi:pheromone shutdown protein TraB